VHHLDEQGFLDDDRDQLRIVRTEELLERWASTYRVARPRDMPARWMLKQDGKRLPSTLARFASKGSRPECCLGLFAAADALGLGFVRGVPPYLYLQRLDLDALRQPGLSLEDTGGGFDVNIRLPSNSETVFRAAVSRDGVPVSDVI
jgi:hypothetical protein